MKNRYLIIILGIFFVCCLSCKTTLQYNIDRFIGTYKYQLYDDIYTLNLDSFGIYSFTFVSEPEGLCYMPYCKVEGTWKIRKKYIILNSHSQNDNPNDYIKQIKCFNCHKDSIKIKVVDFSNNKPVKWHGITAYRSLMKKNSEYFHYLETNEEGLVSIPRRKIKEIDYSTGGCLYKNNQIPPPRKNCYYQIQYRDCYYEIFKNRKIEIRDSILIDKEKIVTDLTKEGKEVHTIMSREYRKVE